MLNLTHLSGLSAQPRSIVGRIQPFSVTIPVNQTSATVSIDRIDPSLSLIFPGGFTTTHTSTSIREVVPMLELTDGVTVTATRATSSASFTVTVYGTVVEFARGAASVQHGSITIGASATSNTASISSVDTSRSALMALGHNCSNSATTANTHFCRAELTDATTVTLTRAASASATATGTFSVVEFAPWVVKSIQPRSVTLNTTSTSPTDTISSVSMDNTLLFPGGATGTSITYVANLHTLQLTAADTVTLTRTNTSSSVRVVNYTAVEFMPGILSAAVQRGAIAVASATSNDAAIHAVPPLRSICMLTGLSTTASNMGQRYGNATLLDTDTVRSVRDSAGSVTHTATYETAWFV